MVIHMDAAGKHCWCTVNINNSTAGGSGFVGSTFTSAQIENWRRYTVCSAMLCNNGRGLFEMVESITLLPWNDCAPGQHPYYDINLGAPLDTFSDITNALSINGATGVYSRRYTNGCVYVNVSGSSKTFTGDRTYTQLDGTAIPGNSITVPNNDGLIVLTTGGGGGGGGTVEQLVSRFLDTYSRTVASGSLGTADSGQTYTLKGTAANFKVNSGNAVVTAPLTAGQFATVNGLVLQDCEIHAQVGYDELPVGGNQTFFVWARADTVNLTGYQVRLVTNPSGGVTWTLRTIVNGTATTLGGTITESFTANLSNVINVKLRVKDLNPTTVQAKVWLEGTSEPTTWENTQTDSTA